MKEITLFIATVILGLTVQAQSAAWIEPGPAADVTSEIKLYVDVTHPDCECPNLIDSSEPMYLWTWSPGDPPGGNGAWDASNVNLEWTQEGPNLYSFPMVPTDFYGVDAPTVYTDSIFFLIKKFNGADTDGTGENKSVDFHIGVIPVGCVNIMCAFPEVFQEDDYLTMTYNNNKETNNGLQDLQPGDVYMYPVALAGGIQYNYLSESLVDNNIVNYPELELKSDEQGFFYTTILTDEFFRINSANPVPDGVPIEKIIINIRRATFSGSVSAYDLLLQCD